jgi:phosphatidylserine/phosphatidylglycerophosphate/cardiolipin synthase-like enzyme
LILRRINDAHHSIDVALYSLSGTPGPGTDIANALVSAKGRGVGVRVICENDNRVTSPFNTLVANGIPLITDTFDPVNNGAGLMHNKFFVIDGRGGAPDSVWVWTGSWNPTDPGTNDDFQNAIEIQDLALAGAYTLEFNEMWGSSTDVPNATASRFGARKTDNTPHRFVIGGRNVECYFSPSDGTTAHIVAALNTAQHSIAFAQLTLTRADIRTALVVQKSAGRKVRGILDNNTDSGTQYAALLDGGVDVLLKAGVPGLFHHKYAIVDAENPAWNPMTITGSHNWSSAAENANNENTMVIKDAEIASQYLQEFTARYYQFGGSDSITVGVQALDQVPVKFTLSQNYPNPFNPRTTVGFQLPVTSSVELALYDVLGRKVAVVVNGKKARGSYEVQINATGLASGVYIYRLTAGRNVASHKMIVLR